METAPSGLVFDIKRYAIHDGPGIRTTVHLKGCPLHCHWCHNPESQSSLPMVLYRPDRCILCSYCRAACQQGAIKISEQVEIDRSLCTGCGDCSRVCPSSALELCGSWMTLDSVMKEIEKERLFYDQSGGGVTLSGGEPLSQPEFTLALLSRCRGAEIATALDTSGFVSEAVISETLPYTSIYLYDIKHMDPELHKRYTGFDNGIILSNLAKLSERGAVIFARMPFIPGVNTSEENLREMGQFLSGLRGIVQLNLLPYHHGIAEDKHRRWGREYLLKDALPPTENALRRAAAVIEALGVKTVIGG